MHTFLSLDMSLIPQSTKDSALGFWGARFSNDGTLKENPQQNESPYQIEPTRLLLDGKNENGVLVHTDATFNAWLKHESNPQGLKDLILSNAIEYTRAQLDELTNNPNSIWYVEQAEV